MTDKNLPDLNFDKVLKDEANLEPFRFALGGKVHELTHIDALDSVAFSFLKGGADADWKLLKMAAAPETYDLLREQRPTVGQVKVLAKAYAHHCGLGDSGE